MSETDELHGEECEHNPGPMICEIEAERDNLLKKVADLKGRVVELERLNGWLSKIADARKAEIERYGISALKGRWVPMLSEARAEVERLTSEVKRLTEWQAVLKTLHAAIDAAGLDISPCLKCGCLVVCLPDGMPMCKACAKKQEGGA